MTIWQAIINTFQYFFPVMGFKLLLQSCMKSRKGLVTTVTVIPLLHKWAYLASRSVLWDMVASTVQDYYCLLPTSLQLAYHFWHYIGQLAWRKIPGQFEVIFVCPSFKVNGTFRNTVLPFNYVGQPRTMAIACVILSGSQDSLTHYQGAVSCLVLRFSFNNPCVWRSVLSEQKKDTSVKLLF